MPDFLAYLTSGLGFKNNAMSHVGEVGSWKTLEENLNETIEENLNDKSHGFHENY